MFGLLVCAILIFLDQMVKIIIMKIIPVYPSQEQKINLIKNIINLTHIENRGAAFGILRGAKWFLIIFTLVALYVFYRYYKELPEGKIFNWLKAGIILIGAGSVGNFIDRLFRGYVVDMIEFIPVKFPIFNIADMYVVIGAILLSIIIIFYFNEVEDLKILENIYDRIAVDVKGVLNTIKKKINNIKNKDSERDK